MSGDKYPREAVSLEAHSIPTMPGNPELLACVSEQFRCYETSSYYEERVRDLGSNSASEGFGLLFDYIHDPERTDKELSALFGPMRLLMGRCQDIQSVRRDEASSTERGGR
jgi:hypothetical protein